jgi:hypothetical protein
VINADGKLMRPVMVVFREPKKPAKFENQLKRFKNIKPFAQKSGMMTSELGIIWFNEIFKKHAGTAPVLIVDSWNGYLKAFEQDKDKIKTHILPPKSTGFAQPLDVYWNRPFKNFIRYLSCKIRRNFNKFHFDVSDREGMASIIDIAIGQFCAPVFEEMVKYAWFAAGYLEKHPKEFLTPVQYCFESIEVDSKCHCKQRAFIKCAHCNNFFCFQHFVLALHRCYK